MFFIVKLFSNNQNFQDRKSYWQKTSVTYGPDFSGDIFVAGIIRTARPTQKARHTCRIGIINDSDRGQSSLFAVCDLAFLLAVDS